MVSSRNSQKMGLRSMQPQGARRAVLETLAKLRWPASSRASADWSSASSMN
jgi:hypothetical protein